MIFFPPKGFPNLTGNSFCLKMAEFGGGAGKGGGGTRSKNCAFALNTIKNGPNRTLNDPKRVSGLIKRAKKHFFLPKITVSEDFFARCVGTLSSQPISFSKYLVKGVDWFDTGDW